MRTIINLYFLMCLFNFTACIASSKETTTYLLLQALKPDDGSRTPRKVLDLLDAYHADIVNQMREAYNQLIQECRGLGHIPTPVPESLKRFQGACLAEQRIVSQSVELVRNIKNQHKRDNIDVYNLCSAYTLFQKGNRQPLREMLLTVPWILCRLTEDKTAKKDPNWAQKGKPIICNALGVDQCGFGIHKMVLACQHAFKPECIKPLLRYLALSEPDLQTRCDYKRIVNMYGAALKDPNKK